jgi:hypothetical protein
LDGDVRRRDTYDTGGTAEDSVSGTDTPKGGSIRVGRVSHDRQALDVGEVVATQRNLKLNA